MLERDAGFYEAVATNEHGEARQRVRLDLAEYPRFIKRLDETFIMARRNGRLEVRVTGIPEPEVKWYKDWQPIADSSRIKVRCTHRYLFKIQLKHRFYFRLDNTTQTYSCSASMMPCRKMLVCTRAVFGMWLDP